MLTLRESLLRKTKDKVAQSHDILSEESIRDIIFNSGYYEIGRFGGTDKADSIKVYKKSGKWFVDVKDSIYCYGTPDGQITDGSFRFGTIDGDFIIASAPEDSNKSKIKSLTYGPIDVKGGFQIWSNVGLTNLKDCPKYVRGGLIINDCTITTLKYFPIYVWGSILISENKKLKSVADTTPRSRVESFSITFNNNGFVSSELTYRELNWEMPYGSKGFRFDKSIAAP